MLPKKERKKREREFARSDISLGGLFKKLVRLSEDNFRVEIGFELLKDKRDMDDFLS